MRLGQTKRVKEQAACAAHFWDFRAALAGRGSEGQGQDGADAIGEGHHRHSPQVDRLSPSANLLRNIKGKRK